MNIYIAYIFIEYQSFIIFADNGVFWENNTFSIVELILKMLSELT